MPPPDHTTGARACVACGCEDGVGCDGGCFRVSTQPPLCSTCWEALPAECLQVLLVPAMTHTHPLLREGAGGRAGLGIVYPQNDR